MHIIHCDCGPVLLWLRLPCPNKIASIQRFDQALIRKTMLGPLSWKTLMCTTWNGSSILMATATNARRFRPLSVRTVHATCEAPSAWTTFSGSCSVELVFWDPLQSHARNVRQRPRWRANYCKYHNSFFKACEIICFRFQKR